MGRSFSSRRRATRPYPFSRLGRAYDYGAILDLALAVAHGGDLSSRVSQDVRALVGGEQVVPRLTYNRAALASAVAGVAGAHDVSATDAMVVLGPDGNFVAGACGTGKGGGSPGRRRGCRDRTSGSWRHARHRPASNRGGLPRGDDPGGGRGPPGGEPDDRRAPDADRLDQPQVLVDDPARHAPDVGVLRRRRNLPPRRSRRALLPARPGAPDGSSAPGADAVPVVGAPPAASTAAPAGPPIAWPSSAARVVGDLPALPTPAATPSVVSSSASPAPVTGPGPVTPQPPAPSGAAVASPGPASSPAVGPSPGTGAYVPLVGNATARVALAALAPKVARNPSDASYLLSAGKVIGVLAGRDGTQLDIDASLSAISAALSSRTEGGSRPVTVQLAVTTVAPALGTDEAQEDGATDEGSGELDHALLPGHLQLLGEEHQHPCLHDRRVRRGPGAWFDFWKVVGVPTLAEGYGLGGEIINGHTEETGAIGGGIAARPPRSSTPPCGPGYQIGDRADHYYYISRYPVGLDATVAMGPGWEQDMTWRNDTAYPVLIHAINGPGTVTFQLFSVDPQRTVTLSTPIVKNYSYATTQYVKVTTLKPGQENQVEYASNGFDAWVTRVVRDASGAIVHQETYYSHYATVNGLIQVRRGAGPGSIAERAPLIPVAERVAVGVPSPSPPPWP